MVCNRCGSEILDNSKFCKKCGHKIKSSSIFNSIFKKKSSKIIACSMLILILVSIGGYSYYSSLPTKNVRKDVQDTAIKYIKEFDTLKQNNWQDFSKNDLDELISFIRDYRKNKNPTPEEEKVLQGLEDLSLSYASDIYNKDLGKEIKNDYDKKRKELKSLLNKK